MRGGEASGGKGGPDRVKGELAGEWEKGGRGEIREFGTGN